MTDVALNGYNCDELVITAATVPEAIAGDLSNFDPNNKLFEGTHWENM